MTQKTHDNYKFLWGLTYKKLRNTDMVAGAHCWPDFWWFRAQEIARSGARERGEGGEPIFAEEDEAWWPDFAEEDAAAVCFMEIDM
jgi:hypothetical protein